MKKQNSKKGAKLCNHCWVFIIIIVVLVALNMLFIFRPNADPIEKPFYWVEESVYENDGTGEFNIIISIVRPAYPLEIGHGSKADIIDFDKDGYPDIYIKTVGSSKR